jgi:hypothetical protein
MQYPFLKFMIFSKNIPYAVDSCSMSECCFRKRTVVTYLFLFIQQYLTALEKVISVNIN